MLHTFKKAICIVCAMTVTGFGSFFASMRKALHPKEEATTQPPTTTEAPYVRPEGVHEAPDGTEPNGERKMLALTFDDGPGGDVTNHILTALQQAGARATFFCLGDRAETYQKTLQRMVRQGCEVASHSYSHERLTRLSGGDLEWDLARAKSKLIEYAGVSPKLLRAPYGAVSEHMLGYADMPVVLWSIDSEDWRYCEELCKNRSEEQRQADFEKVVNSVLDYVQDGDIVLMHDLYSFTEDVAKAVIAELHYKGWEMVTVSELFAAKGIVPETGEVYHSARE